MNKKAIMVGVATFTLLYIFHALLIPFLANAADKSIVSGTLIWLVHQVSGILTCAIAGFISGRLSGKLGFKHGFIVGMLGTILSAFLAAIMPISPASSFPLGVRVIAWLMVNGVITGLAGIFGANAHHSKNLGHKYNEDKKDSNFSA